jgi:gluconate 2-dehydrogenase gamma chain
MQKNEQGPGALPGGPRLSRRAFLGASGSVIGASWLAVQWPTLVAVAEAAAKAQQAGTAFLALSPGEAAGLEAIAARIIPTDDMPGAREAGVIHFIDQALAGFMADDADELRAGLVSLDAAAAAREPGRDFAALDPEAQDALLGEIEETPFFGLMHYLTVAGMFAMPRYGGNRDQLGWKLLGFDHRHGWQPPFGHYDAESAAPANPTGGGHEHG